MSIRRKAPTWEEAVPERQRDRQIRAGQLALPEASLDGGQGGPLNEMTCEYSSELQKRKIKLLQRAWQWASCELVSPPKASRTRRYIHRIADQGDCADRRQRSAIERRAGAERNRLASHNGSG